MNALPALPAPGGAPQLTRLQKAAVVFRMLGSLGMSLPEGALTPEEEAELGRAIDGLGGIDPATLASVIDEFLATLGGAPAASPSLPDPGPPAAAPLPALPPLPGADGGLPMPAMAPLPDLGAPPRAEAAPDAADDPDVWEAVVAQDDEALARTLAAEAPEIAAVIMSKIRTTRAAELLGRLPGAKARQIAYAVSMISDIRPDVVARIGAALAGELDKEPPRAFSEGPVERVGAILNATRAITRNDVLDGLGDADPDFAEAVRKSIFTFANIPARIVPRDLPRIVRGVDQPVLVTALAAAGADADLAPAAEFILANMSQRMAESLRGEIDELDEVSEADGEAAMKEVVDHIRAMEDAGDIYFVSDPD